MEEAQFLEALDELLERSADRRIAIMCSESVWWRCHRRLIADAALLLRGVRFDHLFHDGRLRRHEPTPEARVDENGLLVYDAEVQGRLRLERPR